MHRRSLLGLAAAVFVFWTSSLLADTKTPAVTQGDFLSNGVKIHYTVEGKGEPVLLIHGFSANTDMNWRNPGIIKGLADKYQVISIDNRGHGKSGKPHEPDKYGAEMAEDSIRLLDHLGIKKAHIVGYSMGGMITAKLLTEHPERFISATLGGHGGLKEGDDTSRMNVLAESLENGKGIAPLIVALNPKGKPQPTAEQIAATNALLMSFNDPKALAAVVRGWKGLVVSDAKLKANQVPTLALIGELDPLKTSVDALEPKLPHLKVVVIKDADHMTALNKPEFVEELKNFLAAHSSATTNARPKARAKARAVPAGN